MTAPAPTTLPVSAELRAQVEDYAIDCDLTLQAATEKLLSKGLKRHQALERHATKRRKNPSTRKTPGAS